ncbi:hypothetical protein [Sinomonas sp. ASV322]|uniref:hypothetical protein n=1 Tax=Sinomonas sp. ASV322 TaxID=3041920 RepID=UPI0027DCC1A9|nr:hypothetical protein [Sinomonas sp. ASV322]MDQ4503230.1 hypothetical protein [Sinomonas sp. ASV322]
MNRISLQAANAYHWIVGALVQRAWARRNERERGDVPGWVMITLMSAVLVMGLLAIASPALEGLFRQAISKVSK